LYLYFINKMVGEESFKNNMSCLFIIV